MAREYFKNLPNTTTSLRAERINGLLNGEESIEKIVAGSIEGKNLFDKSTAKRGYYIDSNGSQQIESTAYISDYILLKSNKTYCFSGRGANWSSVAIYNLSKTFQSRIAIATSYTPTTDMYIRFNGLISNIDEAQLELGSTATDYVPYMKYGYNEDTNMGNIVVDDIQNKNKMPLLNNLTYAGITIKSNGDGTYNISGTATANVECVIFKNLTDTIIQNGEDYTLSFNQATPTGVNSRIEFYNDNTYVRGFVMASNTSTTPTAIANTTGANRARFGLFVSNGTTVNLTNLGIQFEKGKVATSFVLPIKSFDATAYVLWTNPSPTSTFATQLVTLNDAIANYKYYEVIYKRNKDVQRYKSTGRVPTTYGVEMGTNISINYIRTITEIWTNSVRFSDCLSYPTYGSSTSNTTNDYLVPYQILGYK